MLRRLTKAKLLMPALLSLVGLGILLGLGVWQMQRKAWKDGLVAKIEARTTQPPVAFNDALKILRKNRDDVDYLPVTVTGEMVHDQEVYFYAPDPKLGPGVHVYTPLRYAADKIVWLNRGFVLDGDVPRDNRTDGLPNGEITVSGVIRLAPSSKASMFTPNNDFVKRRFYWRDLNNMHAIAFDKLKVSAVPFFIDLVIDGQPASAKGPEGGVTRVRLSNRHLEYALTWFGLAATLLVMFAIFVRGRLRDVHISGKGAEDAVT